MIVIQNSFKFLNAVMDILFLKISKFISALLSSKDKLDNDLEISVRRSFVSLRGRSHSLKMKIYFLMHRWSSAGGPYALYIEQEFKPIYRAYGDSFWEHCICY